MPHRSGTRAQHPGSAVAPEPSRIRLRRATAHDLEFLAELVADPDVEPFLAPISAQTPEEFAEEIARAGREPRRYGRLIIERDLAGSAERMGSIAYEVANRRSRIAYATGSRSRPAAAATGSGWRQRDSSSAS